MDYQSALAWVLACLFGGGFIWWYLWCWHTTLFRCQSPRAFFSEAYGESEPFFVVNFLAAIFGAAWVITLITN